MDDWEDEYNADGTAIAKPAPKLAPTEWKYPSDGLKRENVYFGVKNGRKSETSKDWRADRGQRDGGPERRQAFVQDNSGSSTPLTITVENVSVGRIIGMFPTLNHGFHSQQLSL